ncbi:MAG: WhiB family transcriptional regulator [Actinomycetes bacterium]
MDEMDRDWCGEQGDIESRCWAPTPDDPVLLALFAEPEQQEWQERALCAQTDPEAFFPEKGGSTREAKRICLGCEVRAECLEYALSHDERFGIWGGLSERERRRLKHDAG